MEKGRVRRKKGSTIMEEQKGREWMRLKKSEELIFNGGAEGEGEWREDNQAPTAATLPCGQNVVAQAEPGPTIIPRLW